MKPEVHVSIGEVKVGRGDDVLRAILGSCVGIAFLWPERNLFGLAHCLLPEDPGPQHGERKNAEIDPRPSARFVSQAVPSLIQLMGVRPTQLSQIEAVLVGGGNMTAAKNAPSDSLVGNLNVRAAEKILKNLGIKIIHLDVGGQSGRRILVFCDTGKFSVDIIPRI